MRLTLGTDYALRTLIYVGAVGGRLATIPIIALTANAFPEDVAACFDSGMTAFLAKHDLDQRQY